MKLASFIRRTVAIAVFGVLSAPYTASAIDRCKAKILKDGTIEVSATGIGGSALFWGDQAGVEVNHFFNEAICVVEDKAKHCFLGDTGTEARITPPQLCELYLVDGNGSPCTVYLKGCTPGVRSVAPYDLPDGSVVNSKLAPGAVTSDKLAVDSVNHAAMQDNAVGSPEIADASVSAADLASASVGSDEIQPGAVGNVELAFSAVTSDKILDNTINAVDLANDSVGSAEIQFSAVGNTELAFNAVTTDKILDGTINALDLATDSVASAEIQAAAVGSSELADNSVTLAKMADNSVGSAELTAGAVGNNELGSNAVTTDKILDGTVSSSDLADDLAATTLTTTRLTANTIVIGACPSDVQMNSVSYTMSIAGGPIMRICGSAMINQNTVVPALPKDSLATIVATPVKQACLALASMSTLQLNTFAAIFPQMAAAILNALRSPIQTAVNGAINPLITGLNDVLAGAAAVVNTLNSVITQVDSALEEADDYLPIDLNQFFPVGTVTNPFNTSFSTVSITIPAVSTSALQAIVDAALANHPLVLLTDNLTTQACNNQTTLDQLIDQALFGVNYMVASIPGGSALTKTTMFHRYSEAQFECARRGAHICTIGEAQILARGSGGEISNLGYVGGEWIGGTGGDGVLFGDPDAGYVADWPPIEVDLQNLMQFPPGLPFSFKLPTAPNGKFRCCMASSPVL